MQATPAFYKCPACGAIISASKYLSGNALGAVLFSDAYLEAPMMPPYGLSYLGCPKCGQVFPITGNEVKVQGEEAKNVLQPMPSFLAHKKLLAMEKLQIFQQRIFLLWYLWDFNHKISKEEKEKEVSGGDYAKNMDKLIGILDIEKNNIDSRLLLIELLRERGKFAEAEKVLEGANKVIAQLQKIINEEKDRLQAKKTEPFQIKD